MRPTTISGIERAVTGVPGGRTRPGSTDPDDARSFRQVESSVDASASIHEFFAANVRWIERKK
jgi:hypothetical protein